MCIGMRKDSKSTRKIVMQKTFGVVIIIIMLISACVPSSTLTPTTPTLTATQVPPKATNAPTSTFITPIPTPASFPSPLGDRAVFTYYFYWYDVISGDHTESLTDVPVDHATMSWRDVNWHKKQLDGIISSGIDVILPIFWYDEWSVQWSQPGLEKLAQALEQTRLEGNTPPGVGMFLDTTSSTGKDLRLPTEQEYVYKNIHYFFSTIPRDYWALTEKERPILWFYIAYFPSAFDQSFIDYIYEHFEADFGVRPYLVFDESWDYPTESVEGQQIKNTNANHLEYDASYSWGGALAPNSSMQISSIGPGYDDHTVPDRIPPSFTDRKNGDTYQSNFAYAIYCGTPWLAIETWNEYHEATEIAETLQYGKLYLDITKEFTKYFKDAEIPNGLGSAYGNENNISILLGEKNQEAGLFLVPSIGDGQHTPVTVSNMSARQTLPEVPDSQASYLYFSVDDSFYFNTPEKISITVTFFDNGIEPIDLQYDSARCGSPFDIPKMYREIRLTSRHNTQTWQTASIQIRDATFAGNQNFAADFRLATGSSPLIISEIEVQRIP